MKHFKVIHGGYLWLNYHGRALFSLLNLVKTITCPSNLIYHDDVDGESMGELDDDGAHNENDDDDDDDIKAAPQGHNGRRRPFTDPRAGPFDTTDATSSEAIGPSMF